MEKKKNLDIRNSTRYIYPKNTDIQDGFFQSGDKCRSEQKKTSYVITGLYVISKHKSPVKTTNITKCHGNF